MRLDRLLAIVVLLVNRRRVQAKELARLFEVSERTIRRDINAINQAGIPVIAYSGTGGGIGLADHYRIEQSLLAIEDITAVLGALKGLQSAMNDQRLAATVEKMEGLIPREQSEAYQDKSNRLIIDLSPWGGNEPQKDQLALIRRALEEDKLLDFTYTSPEGKITRRAVEGDSLVLKMQHWYLYGYCRLREEFRLFRVSRMHKLVMCDERFIRRPSTAASMPWESEWDRSGSAVELVLRFIPELRALAEDHFAGADMAAEADGSLMVRLRLPENEWLYGMILSYSNGVEVVAPPALRQKIREKLQIMIKNYSA